MHWRRSSGRWRFRVSIVGRSTSLVCGWPTVNDCDAPARGASLPRELAAAHDAFQRLGATPWARRAAVELRATGQAPVVTSASDLAEPLTPQERAIANLAAAGLTNKQIGERLYLSHRTVGGHLYRIFPKLGIGTRAVLPRCPAVGSRGRSGGAGRASHGRGGLPGVSRMGFLGSSRAQLLQR